MGFETGNKDGKHYWLTPPKLMAELQKEFEFDFDACPYPKPDEFDGLSCSWGKSTWVNPPFGSIIRDGKKYGPTVWVRKSIAEYRKGNDVVLTLPTDKWLHYLMAEGAEFRSLGDVRWCAIQDGSAGKGIGRFNLLIVLKHKK